jgi:hypothetical protein
VSFKTGAVRMIENGVPFVETGGFVERAVRAVGCLIEPEIGDTVLLYTGPDGTTYILSLLARGSDHPAELPFPRGMTVRVGGEGFTVEAPKVTVAARRTLSLFADEGSIVFGALKIRGISLDAAWGAVRVVARTVDSIAVRVVQKCRRLYRTVEEFEESRIGRLRCLVNGLLFFRSKDATVQAERTVKMNGERIHLG